MKTVAIAIMTMFLLLAAGYLLGAVLGLVFGLVSTAATKVLYLWNDDKFAPQRRGGRDIPTPGQCSTASQSQWRRTTPETSSRFST